MVLLSNLHPFCAFYNSRRFLLLPFGDNLGIHLSKILLLNLAPIEKFLTAIRLDVADIRFLQKLGEQFYKLFLLPSANSLPGRTETTPGPCEQNQNADRQLDAIGFVVPPSQLEMRAFGSFKISKTLSTVASLPDPWETQRGGRLENK